jgi:hypothetical protein
MQTDTTEILWPVAFVVWYFSILASIPDVSGLQTARGPLDWIERVGVDYE